MRTGTTTAKCIVFYEGSNSNVANFPKYTAVSETMASDLTFACKGKSTTASTVVKEIGRVWYDPD